MKLEVGKVFFNNLNEPREIVKVVDDYKPYRFIDHRDWSYTEDGVYDLVDVYAGDERYTLVRGVGENDVSAWLILIITIEQCLCDFDMGWTQDRFVDMLDSLNKYRRFVNLPAIEPERFDLYQEWGI